MAQGDPLGGGEWPGDNPYAPPQAPILPAVDEKPTDQDWNQRTKHLRRESCIRIAGLFGVLLAGFVVLVFGLVLIVEFYGQEEDEIPSWMYRRWVARLISVISIAVLAFVTNWGLFRLRGWGRWALTVSTTLPVPVLFCGWILLINTPSTGGQESVNPAGLTTLSVMSALSCPLLLYVMWSSSGQMAFSPGKSESIRRTLASRAGCSSIFAALVVLSAESVSYVVMLVIVLTMLAKLELIRSI